MLTDEFGKNQNINAASADSESKLVEQLRLQRFLMEFSVNFTLNDNFDDMVDTSLLLLEELLETDDMRLFINEPANRRWACKYSRTKFPELDKINAERKYDDFYERFSSFKDDPYCLIENIKIGAFKSTLLVPLRIESENFGIIACSTVKQEAGWQQNELDTVGVAAGIMSNALARKQREKELMLATVKAEEASRAKGDFLSRMSHEIRTPMNAIIGMTQIGQNTSDIERMRYCLGKIGDASKHLLGLINDILDMSKIEANKLELIEEPYSLEKMLETIINVITLKADEKKINIFINIDRKIPQEVKGDELRLSQVVSNLLSNAIKFTPEFGRVTLNITRLERKSEHESLVRFEVIDNGIGISSEQQRKLFMSFEQADGNITRRFGGTGLGLAISKRIVELMGGEIGIESELGKGSCFFFNIVLKHTGKLAERRRIDKSIYKDLKVLVIDDAPDILNYFDRALKDFGIDCELASNGEDAVMLVKATVQAGANYDIIFVDYRMEGLDGIETTRAIKKITGESVHIIMISMTDWNEIEQEAKNAGINRFIPKPLFQSSIFNAINEIIAKSKSIVVEEPALAAPEERTFSRCRVLLAEDIEINREIAVSLLESTLINIDCAENGEEAVRLFEAAPENYDIILMDIQMPKMDGLTATKAIRGLEAPWAKEVPIVAMTANAFKEDVDDCKKAGMTDHIGKPIDVDDLFGKIAKYLDGKQD